jgi:type III restriction enzyme
MSNPFFDHPILNAPYEYPARHWELESSGQPTQKIVDNRRFAEFITPIPKPKKRRSTYSFELDMGKQIEEALTGMIEQVASAKSERTPSHA